MSGKRAVLIYSDSSHVSASRTVEILRRLGYSEFTLYAFERENWNWTGFTKEIEMVSLGKVRSRRYLQRLPRIFAAANLVKRLESRREQPADLVYSSMQDCGLIGARLCRRETKFVYEIVDLRNTLESRSLLSKLVRLLDKRIATRANALVFTAEGFLLRYYEPLCPGTSRKAIIIEPRLPSDWETGSRPGQRSPRLPIRVAYVGLVRYADRWAPLIEAVGKRSDRFEFHIHGVGQDVELIKELARKYENVYYHGGFSSDQRREIYENIDLSCAVYDNTITNVRLAIPNKLFESLYFGVPLLVAADTSLAERVQAIGSGFVVDPRKPGFAEEFLDSITPEALSNASGIAIAQPIRDLLLNLDESSDRLNHILTAGCA